MTLRTPRRRISPRTKLRYRAIREFFRRALGSTSQQDIKINSSIAINVTDLKRKIVGLEEHLDKVNRHCRDISYFDTYSRRESESLLQSDLKHDIDTIKEQTEPSSDRKSNGIETQLIYKSECDCKKSDDTEYCPKLNNGDSIEGNHMMNDECDLPVTKVKSKRNKLGRASNTGPKLHKHKTRSAYDNVTANYSTSSFHSLTNTQTNQPSGYPNYPQSKPQIRQEYREHIVSQHHKDRKNKEHIKRNMGDHYKVAYEDKPSRNRKNKRPARELDHDFIADIIRRQYRPVKMFGRRESDLSQFSAPVCRDQEYPVQENLLEDSELCSCFYGGVDRQKRSKPRRQELCGMRSVCDTRLYSSKKHVRQKHHRRVPIDAYSNSDMYDLVPVKERSSPKTRRKFVEDNIMPYEYNREVPPSPRTLRPRLNLKAQYYAELEDYMAHKRELKKRSPDRKKCYQEYIQQLDSDVPSEAMPVFQERHVSRQRQSQKQAKIPVETKRVQEQNHQDTGTMSSLQYAENGNEQTRGTLETTLNKTQETEITVDKTDKALCEIKDILQTFLHEIKKETTSSQCEKSDITCKSQENESNILRENTKNNSNIMPNNSSFNQYGVGQCGITPYMPPPFTNPCCYQVMPVCPMNCTVPVPNGYMMPSQSYTCTNCANPPKESQSAHYNKNIDTPGQTETDELIKEIYKFVAQGPIKKNDSNDRTREGSKTDIKVLTSRSVGGCFKEFLNDAKVGTPPLKCYSKSCEAIGSRIISDTYYTGTTNASYSDTVLEKLSLEPTTQSISETELETESSDPKAKNTSRFSKVLRSFGFFKKKKKDVIEELSESESTVEVDVKPKHPPFRQEITNYMMHSQEYHRPPPIDALYQRRPHARQPGQQEFKSRPHEYPSRQHEYQARPHDYHTRPHEYQARPHDYQTRPQDYQTRPQDYQIRPHEYQIRPHEYQSRPHEYHTRPHDHQSRPHEYQQDYHPPYNPDVRSPEMRGYPSPRLQEPYSHRHQQRIYEHHSAPSQSTKHHPTAPPFNSTYETSFTHIQPPLCLKEIEVKSTGTQSERKMSVFRRFKKKMQQPVIVSPLATGDDYQRTFSTQTPQVLNNPPPAPKPLFNWKNLQAKAMQGMQSNNNDPMAYSLKTQKELAAGDLKLRNAMLKKLFYKRNPFSPRNLIVKTLLGKDKSSFGDPPPVFRPRMFF